MLNAMQKQILDETFNYMFSGLLEDDIPVETILRALEAMINDEAYERDKEIFRRYEILDSIRQIREIYRHRYPQNRSTGSPYIGQVAGMVSWEPNGHGNGFLSEHQGLLGLTAHNDNRTPHVTKADVTSYLDEKINACKNELLTRLSAPQDFRFFARCSRNANAMRNNVLGDKFKIIAARVNALRPREENRNSGKNQLDSVMVRTAIDDVKIYMRTLTGELRLSWTGKDRLPIRLRILDKRLDNINTIVNAIEKCQQDPNKEIELFDAYELLKQNIEYGVIPLSNLEFLVKRSLAGNIPAIPDKFKCPITQADQIMLDPVTASDGFTYERTEIANHIRLNGGFGRAISPMNPGHALIEALHSNRRLKGEIDDFLQRYPIYNEERYHVGQSPHIDALKPEKHQRKFRD